MDKKEKIKKTLKEILKVVVVLLLCGLFGAYLQFGIRGSSAERFLDEYFSYFATNNYKEMYKMSEIENSGLINEETFEIMCNYNRFSGSLNDYKLGEPIKEGRYLTYTIKYYTGKEKEEHFYTVTLHKQKKHYLLFFPTWKVSIDSSYVNDVTIKAPKGSYVKLDGKSIKTYKEYTKEDVDRDTYKLEKIFKGDHNISITTDDEEFSQTKYIDSDNQQVVIDPMEFDLTPAEKSKIYKYSTFVVESIYEYAMDTRRNVNDATALFANTPEAAAVATAVYNNMMAAIQREDGASLRIIDIGKMTPTITKYERKKMVEVKVDYDYTFTAVSGTSTLSGIVENYNGKGTNTATVVLNMINDEWQIVDLQMNCISY
ncbi:hypothetical protein SAMN02910289_01365 [Lachnospiraceae bacterium RM5]|nr:hypothetical protein SAMN02910289_01365 [Lachnospiraceae bacterium RM5]